MTSEGLGEMFEGDSAETCGGKAEGLAFFNFCFENFKSCPRVLKLRI